MHVDAENRFSNAQPLTVTAASTNYIDLSAVRDIGSGCPVYAYFVVTTAFTDTGSNSTITVTLETDDEVTFTSPTVAQTVGIFAALSAVGTVLIAALDPGQVNLRYCQARYTTTNGDLSTGSITGFVTLTPHRWVPYADNITIT